MEDPQAEQENKGNKWDYRSSDEVKKKFGAIMQELTIRVNDDVPGELVTFFGSICPEEAREATTVHVHLHVNEIFAAQPPPVIYNVLLQTARMLAAMASHVRHHYHQQKELELPHGRIM